MGLFRKYAALLAILILFLAQAALFCVIPLSGADVFLSPDETANAVAARSFSMNGSMRIVDDILKDGPWLRPRSFVTQGNAMVPVGFLGLPMIIGSLRRLLGEFALLFVIPLLVLSAGFPLWKFLQSSGRTAQIAGVAMWLGFPTVILYANRGLYPNLPVVCFGLWSAYLVWSRKAWWSTMLAGFAFGLAIAIRPVEVVWLSAWIIGAWFLRKEKTTLAWKEVANFAVSAFAPMCAAAFVAWKTYGSIFAVGYFLRDTAPASIGAQGLATPSSPSAAAMWPFGFHPRNMWFNVRSYLFGEWLPWTVIAALCAGVTWRRREGKIASGVALWTLIVCVCVYGQSIYQDHVGINVVSSGNSFLRYMIPMAAVFALSFGVGVGMIAQRYEKKRLFPIFIAVAVALFVVGGTKFAFDGDDENLINATQELQRYQSIRASTFARFGFQTIVLSDRSDKIFFPIFRVASPLPSKDQIYQLVEQAHASVTLFTETLDDTAMIPWKNAGIQLRPIIQNQNQSLYVLSVAPASLK